jgi:hypothetical protein
MAVDADHVRASIKKTETFETTGPKTALARGLR